MGCRITGGAIDLQIQRADALGSEAHGAISELVLLHSPPAAITDLVEVDRRACAASSGNLSEAVAGERVAAWV
ncbi:hypothetical protein K1719_001318 [Acacia pycnantha]|nr:hypothetical protein K1719_001318 [Acacia pycnantha]